MTRPKVDPEKRQRTANACDSCKRRKQKCDGLRPCSTCSKKQFSCTYSTGDHDSHDEPSPSQPSSKKRARESDIPPFSGPMQTNRSSSNGNHNPAGSQNLTPYRLGGETPSIGSAARAINYFPQRPGPRPPEVKVQSDLGSASGGDEEADNHTMTRMLDDGTGRLIYVGDAASLSFLQLLRMIVETTAGPSPFTMDPERHRITETTLSLSPDTELTHLLPEKQTALILVDSFFVNTHGVIEVFDEDTFLANMERCYSNPLSVDHIYLCHLNLVFAIGLCYATPVAGSPEAAIIDSLRRNYPDQSEIFYLNAKSLNNPIIGFEDADFWSIQALLLMGVYMLVRAKRNTAFAYIGMAVRTAYTLGLHREETLVIFSADEQSSRRKLWRSLFILDRFLAASLGRPVAILEDECSGEVLHPSQNISLASSHLASKQICTAGLEAAVRSSHVVGIILRKVYLRRKISTRLAQELADQCKTWPENLSPALHWRQASPDNRRQAIAILHSNIVYCHSIILLSRPFFLYLLSAEIQRTRLGPGQLPKRPSGRMAKFSDACMIASKHTVALIQNAYEGQYLPKLNPFVTYSLFAAALVIFADEFARPFSNALSGQCMTNSIIIMSYCGEMDPSAKRMAHILTEFRNVIYNRSKQLAFQLQPPYHTPLPILSPNVNTQNNSSGLSFEPGFAPMAPLPGATQAPLMTPTPSAISTISNPLNTSTLAHPSIPNEDFFSGLLDLTNTVLPSGSDPESVGGDEPIDFDTLWQWPGGDGTPTPGFETPAGGAGQGSAPIQGPGGSAGVVSLFEQV